MTHDYKFVLDAFDETEIHMTVLKGSVAFETIRHALKVADKLMQEPSGNMVQSGYDAHSGIEKEQAQSSKTTVESVRILGRSISVFKAMRDQMFKEIE